MSSDRKLTYSLAINEAIKQSMRHNKDIILLGQGVKSPWYVGSTCMGLISEFTENRVIDTPVSENAMTGAAIGAAVIGTPSIIVHPRIDFMMYALDPIINQAANWHYMSGGEANVPVVIWGIINRGGEQGAQHSQALHALFAHIPGLKLVMPSSPEDAKGLMISAIEDPNPVVFIDDRWLYNDKSTVPEEMYRTPIGQCKRLTRGDDLTIVSNSFMTKLALEAYKEIASDKITLDIIDLRTIKPLDTKTIFESVQRTGKLLVLDGGWKSFGVSSEIIARVALEFQNRIIVDRVALEDIPAPASSTLEKAYYPDKSTIIDKIHKLQK